MTRINGIDPVAAAIQTNQRQQQAAAMLQADIAQCQRMLYIQLAAPYLASIDPSIGQEADPAVLRALAERAKHGAMFIYEAQGLLTFKEPT